MRSAADVSLEALHQAFVASFADYLIGPFQVAIEQFPHFLARQGIDLALSRVVEAEGRVQAFAFVAPRCGRWRLGTMGARPSARGSGAAAALLDDFIVRAGEAGLAQVELEVFAQNERALRLYRSRGFLTRHELHGYELAPLGDQAPKPAPFDALAREDALTWLREHEPEHLPLQMGAQILGLNPAAWTAWRRGQAQLVWSLAGDDAVQILNLIDLDPAQRDAEALLQALRESEPQRVVRQPQLLRPDLGGEALLRLGAKRLPLHQLLMQRPLGALPIRGLDHLVLRVRDVDTMLGFYVGVLGCQIEKRQDAIGLIQLRAGSALIDLLAMDSAMGRAGGAAPHAEGHNMDHFCLHLAPWDEAGVRRHLEAHGIAAEPAAARYGAGGEGPSIYLKDPEGNRLELKG